MALEGLPIIWTAFPLVMANGYYSVILNYTMCLLDCFTPIVLAIENILDYLIAMPILPLVVVTVVLMWWMALINRALIRESKNRQREVRNHAEQKYKDIPSLRLTAKLIIVGPLLFMFTIFRSYIHDPILRLPFTEYTNIMTGIDFWYILTCFCVYTMYKYILGVDLLQTNV